MNKEFIEALAAVAKERNISEEMLFKTVEQALVSAYKRSFSNATNVRVSIDTVSGELNVFSQKTIVEEIKDPRSEETLENAKRINPEYQLGDIIENEVTPQDFGRIAAQTAKQVVVQRLREAERGMVYDQYADREGEIIGGMIQRYEQKNIIVELDNQVEALLPLSEQVMGEDYSVGKRLSFFVVEVKRSMKGPQIIASRSHPGLLRRLFELEVPELYDGTVEMKSIAREAGQRSKVAVYSKHEDIDPVGACVGPKGARVQAVVNELNGEKIDIVNYSEDMAEYVANALSPAKTIYVDVLEDGKSARVIVPDYQLSLAIGKEGQNARLAAKLTNFKIDIKSESQAESENL
ncbi:MAG: transcription termination/antitermination protein NusA [Firmicutes bacterium]|nr:transcription termination/antitermination protein NusA [Bacillota bacterium]